LATRELALVKRVRFDPAARAEGRDWPPEAETMIGLRRLDNLQECITDVLRKGVSGDLLEAGVWRGGAAIFMRGVLAAYGDERTVWAADSFHGLPEPDPERYPADLHDDHWSYAQLAIPLEDVRSNFERYGLLDDKVRFLVGWFRETLPAAPIQAISVLRIDGDMYESTMDVLTNLYTKVSIGGYVIIDDYGTVEGCKAAVNDFRTEHGITERIERIDWAGVYWKRLT
jgi:O-methyltransferase